MSCIIIYSSIALKPLADKAKEKEALEAFQRGRIVMRTIIDRNDTEWVVDEIPPDPVDSRGPGQRLLDPVGAALVFTSHKGRVVISIDTGAFNKMTDSDLLNLLEESP